MARKQSRRGRRILSAREAAQWDEDRIRRFEEDQRRKREYISFVEIAEWYSDLAGPVSPKKAAALREQAYRMLESDLLERRFEEDGRFVLFLHPGVSLTHWKMTAKWYQQARENNLDNEQGRSYLRHCWLPRSLFEDWCAWHNLPKSPPRFQPEHAATMVAQPTAVEKLPKAILKRRRPARERIRQELEEKAPQYIDTPGGETCWSIAKILVETRGSARKFELDKTSKALKRYYADRLKDRSQD